MSPPNPPAAPAASPSPFDQARQHFVDGLAQLEAGRLEAAEQAFRQSLALVPGRVSTLVNLAATRLRLQRPLEALQAADEALGQAPDDRNAWLHRSAALSQLGRTQDALAACDRLIALDPALAPVWLDRGSLLRELGRLADAAESFRRAQALGADPELVRYCLASVAAEPMPARAPQRYVRELFDQYANEFEQHLVDTLHYQAHAVVVRHLAELLQARAPGERIVAQALDLGCGTGLCGPLLRPLARSVTGIDLSPRMLEQARRTGAYDALHEADLIDYLGAPSRRYDLIVATDVFVYVGELVEVFAAVRAALNPQGLFGFSVEEAPAGGPGVRLLPSLRYAHSEDYLRALASRHDLDVVRCVREPVRRDQHEPVDGLFMVLTPQR